MTNDRDIGYGLVVGYDRDDNDLILQNTEGDTVLFIDKEAYKKFREYGDKHFGVE